MILKCLSNEHYLFNFSCVVFFRGLLFHYKKSCYFAIGFYFFGKSIQENPDSVCKNDVNNEQNICGYCMSNQ